MVKIVTVDDTNTVQLKYDNKWFHGNWTDTSTQPPSNRSLLSSNDVTAQMVLVFPVVGTGISYYGMRRSGGGSYRICIDCDPNQPAGPFDPIDALNVTDNGQSPPVLLYSKQGLTNDIHTVVLMNTNDTRVHPQGASQITLDRFEITTQDPPVVTVTGSATSTATDSVPSTSNSSAGSSAGTTVNPGLIVGVVIGALALLALLLGLFLCWRRKDRLASNIEDGYKFKAPNPLVIRSRHGHRPSPPEPILHPMSSSTTLVTQYAKGSAPHARARGPRLSVSASSSLPESKALVSTTSSPSAPPTTLPVLTRPRMETDAGPISEDDDTLPPDYAQVFHSRSASEPPAELSSTVPSGENIDPPQTRKRS